MTIHLGTIGHFGLAVRDPRASAAWWARHFDLHELFAGDDYVGMTNEDITIVLQRGEPSPQTLDHVSFHLPDLRALRDALAQLRAAGVELEDPGDEIGPEAPGSPNVGLWFRDPDGYRWELSVLDGARRS